MNKMTHEEYIQKQRQKVCGLAAKMLEGSIAYLEGAVEISALRFDLDIAKDDEDILVFSLISSETDHLPIGGAKFQWSKEALLRLEPEYESSTNWAKEVSLSNCKNLLKRFGR